MKQSNDKSSIILYFFLFHNCTARLAQSVERGTFNPEVKGSSPLSGDQFFFLSFFFHSGDFQKLLIVQVHG